MPECVVNFQGVDNRSSVSQTHLTWNPFPMGVLSWTGAVECSFKSALLMVLHLWRTPQEDKVLFSFHPYSQLAC